MSSSEFLLPGSQLRWPAHAATGFIGATPHVVATMESVGVTFQRPRTPHETSIKACVAEEGAWPSAIALRLIVVLTCPPFAGDSAADFDAAAPVTVATMTF